MSNNNTKSKSKAFKPPKKISERYLHNSGLYYLQRFATSRAHFERVMMNKVRKSCAYHKDQSIDDCAKMVKTVAERFEELGLLNDRLYTQGVVTSMRRSAKSERAILAKLKQKGLPEDLIREMLDKIDMQDQSDRSQAELNAAIRLAKKRRIGPYSNDTEAKKEDDYKRALGILARAGFGFDTAQKVLEMSLEDAEELRLNAAFI